MSDWDWTYNCVYSVSCKQFVLNILVFTSLTLIVSTAVNTVPNYRLLLLHFSAVHKYPVLNLVKRLFWV